MNLNEAQRYIEHLSVSGIKPGLDRMRNLCAKLGDPQNSLNFIHVAGTNGKGSVCAYISEILNESGYKVGRYTSPAVVEDRERYQINGRNVSQAAYCRNLEEVKAASDLMVLEGSEEPTLFEIETALAFMIFMEAGCEIVVLECGMGGAQDATNIIHAPLVSVITRISLDHTRYLGKTVEAIAKEKSGIIKKGTHVVTIAQSQEILNVIKARASLEKADLTIADPANVKNLKQGLKASSFDYGKYKGLKISLIGTWQTENAMIAISAIEALKKEKIKIDENKIKDGLIKAAWPGRFEIIAKNPMVIVDGAHNENAARRLSETVDYFLHNEEEKGKIIYIFGVLGDKNYPAIAEIMGPHAAHIITVTPPDNPRALPAQELADTVSRYNRMVSVAGSLEEALEMAYLLADKDSVILAFGSLSFLGEIRRLVDSKSVYLKKKQITT
ncbi:MAG: bifunctional folylpolyglutamate synthase/dihydrofolate synthase [Lachnospiraceae bacterium]|nr:bifunctional folylpolyglutamate synthase/dihydrofolate synthase [Lachnospiraceae bacterium]